MGSYKDNEKYIRNCATTIKGQLGIKPEQFQECKTFAEIQAALRKTMMGALDSRLRDSPDEQVGRLAYIRNTMAVRDMAAEALIPVIASKIWAERNPRKVVKCRFCDYTVLKFVRGREGTAFDVMREHIDDDHPHEAKKIATSVFGGLDERKQVLEEEDGST